MRNYSVHKMRKLVSRLVVFLLPVWLFSCGINSNVMLKTPIGEFAAIDSLPIKPNEPYRIGIDDKLSFLVATNDGAKILDGMAQNGGGQQAQGNKGMEFTVQLDSTILIPLVGKVKVGGLTVVETEIILAQKFSKDFINPFVKVTVLNKRVIVFPGGNGDAQVVNLQNDNTTLMEVLASAGGIPESGKASRIKIIRKVDGTRKVFLVDLSTIDGLKYTDLVVQSSDYIYIEPKPRLASAVLREVAPILSLVSTSLAVISILTLLK